MRYTSVLAVALSCTVCALSSAQESPLPRYWIVGDSVKVLPGADLGPSSEGGVELEGAGGETVSFQLVLESPVDLSRVRVLLSDVESASARIPLDRYDVFLETYLDLPPVHEKIVALPPGRHPDPLVPLWMDGPGTLEVAHPLELPASQRRVLWIDLRIPRGERAGTYTGRIELELGGEEKVGFDVRLELYPFDLPARPSLEAWVPLYPNRFVQRENISSLDAKEAFELAWRYFRMAHEHRFVTQSIDQEPQLSWNESTGELLGADWTTYDLVNGPVLDGSLFEDGEPPAIWKVGGFVYWGARPGESPYFGGTKRDESISAAHRRALTDYAREIRRHFDEKGWSRSELFMYMIDEPDLKALPGLAKIVSGYGDAIHEARADVRHLVTMAPSASAEAQGAVDVWAVWGAGYRPSEMKARQALGERTWFYQKHEPFVGGHALNHEATGLRSWAWIAWRYGVDGVFLWAGNYWNRDPYRDPLNWNADLLGNGTLFYPGAMLPTIGFPAIRGPVGSIRMKSLRRGLLDYEYFALLRDLGGDPDPLVESIIRSALNEEGYDPIWKHPLWEQHGDWSHDPRQWDAVRREIARRIITLGAKAEASR